MSPAYLYVAATVLIGACGQVILKWQTDKAGSFPDETGDRLRYLADLLVNPWVIGSLLMAFVAALCWIVALSQIELSRAYPFVSGSFVLVLLLSAVFFAEPLTIAKVAGAMLIVTGLIVGSQA